MPDRRRLILASASQARKAVLSAAGLAFDIVPADIDEAELRRTMRMADPRVTPAALATALASQKARAVSEAHSDALVIGADQVLALGDKTVSKARNHDEAKSTLLELRGRTHYLVSAVALAGAGNVFWQTHASARMTMRDFSEPFLVSYLKEIGHRALYSVGCYELESLGVQLFDAIDGDYFTILGLPLLPLLQRLRIENAVPA